MSSRGVLRVPLEEIKSELYPAWDEFKSTGNYDQWIKKTRPIQDKLGFPRVIDDYNLHVANAVVDFINALTREYDQSKVRDEKRLPPCTPSPTQ